jgi:hypothetical protein
MFQSSHLLNRVPNPSRVRTLLAVFFRGVLDKGRRIICSDSNVENDRLTNIYVAINEGHV